MEQIGQKNPAFGTRKSKILSGGRGKKKINDIFSIAVLINLSKHDKHTKHSIYLYIHTNIAIKSN